MNIIVKDPAVVSVIVADVMEGEGLNGTAPARQGCQECQHLPTSAFVAAPSAPLMAQLGIIETHSEMGDGSADGFFLFCPDCYAYYPACICHPGSDRDVQRSQVEDVKTNGHDDEMSDHTYRIWRQDANRTRRWFTLRRPDEGTEPGEAAQSVERNAQLPGRWQRRAEDVTVDQDDRHGNWREAGSPCEESEEGGMPRSPRPQALASAAYSQRSPRSPHSPRSPRTPRHVNWNARQHTLLRAMKFKVPIVTFLCIIVMWAFFIWGITYVIGWDNVEFNDEFEPLSPPQKSFRYYIVSEYPTCADLRGEVWRLLAHQVVHSGLRHVGGNTIGILVYGAIVESSHPIGHTLTLLVFEVGVVLGALGFTYSHPYGGLVGCSGGVYSLMGSGLAHVISHWDTLPFIFSGAVLAGLLIQLLGDVAIYIILKMPNVAYMCHVCGFIAGLLATFAINTFLYTKSAAGLCGMISCALLVVFTALIVFNDFTNWPPTTAVVPFVDVSIFNDDLAIGCCHDMFQLLDTGLSQDEITGSYYCDEGTLTPY